MEKKILKAINSNTDTYIIFFSYSCGYSVNALNLLKKSKLKFKGYDIDKICSLSELLNILISSNIDFDKHHRTKPIVFYNGKFIGGYTELNSIINKK